MNRGLGLLLLAGVLAAGCSASSKKPGPMHGLDCSKVAGTKVPKSIGNVICTSKVAARVTAQALSCKAGGKYFWLSPESADGSDLTPYVGRPGGRWVKLGPDRQSSDLGAPIGC
jgi:hypothetical protein